MTKKHTIIAGIGLACFLIIASCSSVLAALTGGTGGLGGADLNYQCDSVMGPDSSGVISLPEQPAGVASSDIPTTNPYASAIEQIDPTDTDVPQRIHECLSTLQSAPYQAPPLASAATGAASRAAATLAQQAVTQRWTTADNAGSLDGPTNNQFSPPALVRWVIYQASGRSLVLPNTTTAQMVYGQRVNPTAVSAGDLIFTDFVDGHPRTCLIAISSTQAVYAPAATIATSSAPSTTTVATTTAQQPPTSARTTPANSARIELTSIPPAGNIVVKRVLKETS